jgi:hypothetical protein
LYTVKLSRLPKNDLTNTELLEYFQNIFGKDKIIGKMLNKIKDAQVSPDFIKFADLIEKQKTIESIIIS